jgi:Uma2 family endonuclease
MVMPATAYHTAQMVRALPDDGNRYETVHGELLVTPAPRAAHQLVVERLVNALGTYLRQQRVGQVWISPADISWEEDTLVQPDCFVVPIAEARTLDWTRMKTLLLVVEILSPGTARADRFTKRRLYQEQRIPLYWIVDPDARQVEVWTPEAMFPVVVTDVLSWHPEGATVPCLIPLDEFFRPL